MMKPGSQIIMRLKTSSQVPRDPPDHPWPTCFMGIGGVKDRRGAEERGQRPVNGPSSRGGRWVEPRA